jgi:DNA-binding XRE family transcriptional regulator
MKFDSQTKAQLIQCAKTKNLYIEGNILKILDSDNDEEFSKYIQTAIQRDKESQRKRLDMTKHVQAQNIELTKSKAEKEKINEELKTALEDAEKAKETALNDLDLLQKKTQYQLIESIVKVSLWIICGIGVVTTIMFAISLLTKSDNKIVESAWSNMFGILLTNSFSIIGTIMGVKYASEKKSKCKCEEEN